VRPPKSPRRLPKALSVDEAARCCWRRIGDDDPCWRLRDTAMFELFYSSGFAPCGTGGARLRCARSVAGMKARSACSASATRRARAGRGSKAREALAAWQAVREQLAATGEKRRCSSAGAVGASVIA
jgi:integrase/recombinase XerC